MFDDILKKEEKHIKCCMLCGSDNIKTKKEKFGLILVNCSDCNLSYFTEL